MKDYLQCEEEVGLLTLKLFASSSTVKGLRRCLISVPNQIKLVLFRLVFGVCAQYEYTKYLHYRCLCRSVLGTPKDMRP